MNQLILLDKKNEYSITHLNHQEIYSHLTQILKVQLNDKICCSVLNHGCYEGKILEIDQNKIKLQLDLSVSKSSIISPYKKKIELFVGICRPNSMKKILEWGASLGVEGFYFFKAQLTDPSYLNSNIFQCSQFTPFLIKGLQQTRGLYKMPQVYFFEKLDNCINSTSSSDDKSTLFCSLNSSINILQIKNIKSHHNIQFFIGPERGFTIKEEELFLSNNFKAVGLSSKILRTELAMVTALGQLELV